MSSGACGGTEGTVMVDTVRATVGHPGGPSSGSTSALGTT